MTSELPLHYVKDPEMRRTIRRQISDFVGAIKENARKVWKDTADNEFIESLLYINEDDDGFVEISDNYERFFYTIYRVDPETGELLDITGGWNQYGEEGTFEAATRYAEEYSAMTPGVRVEIEWVPGDYNAALNAALLTDEGPDVFEVQTVDVARVNAGQLEPLNDLFSDEVLADFSRTRWIGLQLTIRFTAYP